MTNYVELHIKAGKLDTGADVVELVIGNNIYPFTTEAAKQIGMELITVARDIERWNERERSTNADINQKHGDARIV